MTKDVTLGDRLARLAQEAVVLYAEMTGDADVPESFIRDQIAIGVYNEDKDSRHCTSMELLLGEGVRNDVIDVEKRATYDAQIRVSPYSVRQKIDLIIWHPAWPNPRHPLAIAEVKRGQRECEDLERTSFLLGFCHPETLGYQVIAQVCEERRIQSAIDRVNKVVKRFAHICGPLTMRQKVHITERDQWCMAFVIPILRQLLPSV
jgi:hypothetical protein